MKYSHLLNNNFNDIIFVGEGMSVTNLIKNNKKFQKFLDKYIPDETYIRTIDFYNPNHTLLVPNNLGKDSYILGVASEYLFMVAINKVIDENNQISFDNLNSDKGLKYLEIHCENKELFNKIKGKYNEIKTYLKWESFYSNLYVKAKWERSDIFSTHMIDVYEKLLKKDLKTIKSRKYDFYFNLDDICVYAIFCARLELIYKNGIIPDDLYVAFFEIDKYKEMITELKEILKLFIKVFIMPYKIDGSYYEPYINNTSSVYFHPENKKLFDIFHGFEIDMILDENIVDFKSSAEIKRMDWAQLLIYIIFWSIVSDEEFTGFIYLSRYGIIKQIDLEYIVNLYNNEEFQKDFFEILCTLGIDITNLTS